MHNKKYEGLSDNVYIYRIKKKKVTLKTTVFIETRKKPEKERISFSLDLKKKEEHILFVIDEDNHMKKFLRYI